MKTIVITGGTGLLGTAVVSRLSRQYRCVVLYHGQEGWQALRRVVDVEGIPADLANEADVTRAFEKCGEIHGVVHLVGGFAPGDAPETWSKMLALNLMTAVTVTRAGSPHLANRGRIIAVSSQATLEKPAGLSAYIASKSALNALIQVLAVELKERQITANALLPGALGKAGEPGKVPIERVAGTIAWLLSDEAANVTGALLPMSP